MNTTLDTMTDDERKAHKAYDGCFVYFPNALAQVGYASTVGQEQHGPDDDLGWHREKSQDELGSLSRHLLDYAIAERKGDYEGMADASRAIAWRALAHNERFFATEAGDPARYQKVANLRKPDVCYDTREYRVGYKRIDEHWNAFTANKVYFPDADGSIRDDNGKRQWGTEEDGEYPKRFFKYFKLVFI